MEFDRYKQNQWQYMMALLCLIASMGLFIFTAYILPFLLLKVNYDIPEFIFHWQHYLVRSYNMTPDAASWTVFLIFLLLSIVTAVLAYVFSNNIDNVLVEPEVDKTEEKPKARQEAKETTRVLSKIIFIVIIVFSVAALLEWLIYIPPGQ